MSRDIFTLSSQTALITGGGTGIGFGIAKKFVSVGANVVIAGRREHVLRKARRDLGNSCNYVVHDITDTKKSSDFVKEIESKFGPLDILVNNAGSHHKDLAQNTTDEEFAQVIQTNLLGVFSLTRECAKGMLARKKGSILMISSMTALFGIDRVSAYSASKAALTGLINSLVTEYSTYNVRVNAIAPGWIESEMFFKAINSDPKRKQQIVNRIALDGFGTPEDIGNAAVFLSSDAARYITGVILPVDGGARVNF